MALIRLLFVTILTLIPASLLQAVEQNVQLEDGRSIRLFFFEPAPDSEPPPLAIFIAGGSSNEFMAKAQFWLGKEFVDRGWAIAVPISPDGNQFSDGDSAVLEQLIAHLYRTNSLEETKPLLVGMSSGGSEALLLATQAPQLYRGVISTPGRIAPETPLTALEKLPIYIRIGEKDDFRWNRMLEPMSQKLREAGAVVNAEIVEDARHVFQVDWESLENWLDELK